MHTQRRMLRIGAAAIMLGSICPWATAFGLIAVNGLQCGWGWITLLAGAGVLVADLSPRFARDRLAWLADHARWIELLLCGLVAAVCLLVVIAAADPDGAQATWGLYLTLVASVATVTSTARVSP